PRDAKLVLGVPDALLELPAVGIRLAPLDPLERGLRRLELLLRTRIVDVVGLHRVVDERDGAIFEHLEETRARRELVNLAGTYVHPRRAGLQHRHERRVPREDAD